jgi:hypothetical protein
VVVFSNRRLGARSELIVSPPVAAGMLRDTAACARPGATGRWEIELVRWLEHRARESIDAFGLGLDVSEIAWTPEHFEVQRSFLIGAIRRAAAISEHASALRRWAAMIEAHPRDSVQVGRRWLAGNLSS